MNALARVATFTAGLFAIGGVGAAVGAAVGPLQAAPAVHGDAGHDSAGAEHSRHETEVGLPGGLMIAQDGYSLNLASRRYSASPRVDLRFQIRHDDEPLTAFERVHGKDLHLIVVRRDLTGFQHVHPTMDGEGLWSVPVDLSLPGEYRVFADFKPAGVEASYTLGADLSVPGTFEPRVLTDPTRTSAADGYEVSLTGDLVPGTTSELTVSVARAGKAVTDLEPYLEAYGHLVALRDGDLAYLHVHPEGHPGDGVTRPGPEITFQAAVPSAGTYKLFLDFQHGSAVRTASFTVRAGAGQSAKTPAPRDGRDSNNSTHQHEGKHP